MYFLFWKLRCFLCTVGSVYIKSKEALAKDVLKHLVGMFLSFDSTQASIRFSALIQASINFISSFDSTQASTQLHLKLRFIFTVRSNLLFNFSSFRFNIQIQASLNLQSSISIQASFDIQIHTQSSKSSFEAMDKSWITQPQTSYEYIKGLNGFLDFAFKNRLNGMAKCPCKKCGFKTPQFRNVMYDHLRVTPFPVGYTCWCYHGEVATGENNNGSPNNPLNLVHDNTNVEDPIQNMINDAFGVDRNHSNEVPIASNVDIEIDEDVMPNTTQ
ncbi:hypothetical protein QL285_057135 [Trifolium repens]|nr:hypothetical protein QL285_057135 [Trifolium repens]